MMTLDELWESLRQDPEIKATMEEVDKSYKLFKKIENLIIADLEAKLAESESESNARYNAWQEEIGECDRLRVALAEKEKEIKSLRTRQFIDMTEKEILELKIATHNQDLKKIRDVFNQSQNQTVIAELEKVKELIKNNIVGMGIPSQKHFISPIINGIDQQIKELKGEK